MVIFSLRESDICAEGASDIVTIATVIFFAYAKSDIRTSCELRHIPFLPYVIARSNECCDVAIQP